MSAIEILEQSVNLLRAAPMRIVVKYLIGAVPFMLALLFFLSDMTRSPFAAEHLAAASLGLAVLYIWKNVWQALFEADLYTSLAPGTYNGGNLPRLIAIQGTLQPLGLVLMLPFPWLVAFFRNVGIFAALGAPDPLRIARRQAGLWTRQNWGVLALITLAGLLLFVNVLVVIVLLPQLARSFLGVEGDFARLGQGMLNEWTAAVALALTWLVVDPLLDAVYVLRCFHGESIATGEDLRAAFRRAIAVIALVVIAGITFVMPHPAVAQTPPGSIDTTRLDRSMSEVIHRREFTWRMPAAEREEVRGPAAGWMRSAMNMIGDAWNWVKKAIRAWLEPKPEAEGEVRSGAVTPRTLELLIGLVAVLVAIASLVWFRRRKPVEVAKAVAPAVPAVDLSDESVTADQLPEDSWMKLAEEWLAKGDFRMALRALHLAGLNFLGERGLISIQRWKSGLDYRREVDRRGRASPGLAPVFARNLGTFEQGWYGRHPVDREMVAEFAQGLKQMRSQVQ